MNDLIVSTAIKHLVLYRNMVEAISSCLRIDECKDILNKSVALAAYFEQIRDDDTVQKFHQVKLRAWRRIGHLFSTVDTSDCETQTAKIKKIRASFDEAVVAEISESRVREILELMKVPDRDFEHILRHNRDLTGSIPDLITRTPEHKAMAEKNRERWAREAAPKKVPDHVLRKQQKQKALEIERMDRAHRHLDDLTKASNAAMREVGVSLETKERSGLRQLVLLVKPDVHAVMKQAAADKGMTVQALLLNAFSMWLGAYGYEGTPETRGGNTAAAKSAPMRPI